MFVHIVICYVKRRRAQWKNVISSSPVAIKNKKKRRVPFVYNIIYIMRNSSNFSCSNNRCTLLVQNPKRSEKKK